MSYQQPPYEQQPYGYPPQAPPMQYQQPPPQQIIVQEEKKDDKGCCMTWSKRSVLILGMWMDLQNELSSDTLCQLLSTSRLVGEKEALTGTYNPTTRPIRPSGFVLPTHEGIGYY
ncbi:hypothetical protein ASPSYDRAFT_25549 [Aspergillus sydowii CBS 593.65]|uniref:Uncharacterized protein n=1 Tax=Aspergillus sydowii CBS 593.65 TaxID=1036612 RepID=A0A1L9TVM0_9EURO|nr:uncharacterized protein ASPSYDRAFT_25549 [Aspergillus sydowii CBS 593.65]OJJ63471.1 hypothetical protein ASPSYDRAFT_25549 [Aspergillus sydowii CBS 593.65]